MLQRKVAVSGCSTITQQSYTSLLLGCRQLDSGHISNCSQWLQQETFARKKTCIKGLQDRLAGNVCR
jgi:hypothetical protein